MKINVTARHFEMSDELRDHATQRLEKIERFGHPLIDAHVVLTVEKRRQTAEVTVNGKHATFTARTESHDMVQSVDEACDKVQTQIRKHVDKVREHRAQPDAAG